MNANSTAELKVVAPIRTHRASIQQLARCDQRPSISSPGSAGASSRSSRGPVRQTEQGGFVIAHYDAGIRAMVPLGAISTSCSAPPHDTGGVHLEYAIPDCWSCTSVATTPGVRTTSGSRAAAKRERLGWDNHHLQTGQADRASGDLRQPSGKRDRAIPSTEGHPAVA